MANIKWGMTVDANQNEVLNLKIHNVNGNPSTPVAGQVWYDTATGKFMYRDGVGAANVDMRARANHTGQQTASTISDFTTAVQAIRWASMVAPNASVDLNSQKIVNLLDPTGPQDAASKAYVDSALATSVAGIAFKKAVRVASTANVTVSNPGTSSFDGVTLSNGDRILLKNQSTASQNGIYVFNGFGSALTRSTDADSAAELEGGIIVPVDEGTANNNTAWMLATDIVTLGTDSVTWVQFGAGSAYTASLGVQLVGSDFRANLGTGLTLSGNQIIPDFGSGANKVMRAKIAVGFVGSGSADAVINHALALANKSDVLVEVTEDSTGAKVQVGVVCTDANNVTLSFASAPTTNQYRYQILGLS